MLFHLFLNHTNLQFMLIFSVILRISLLLSACKVIECVIQSQLHDILHKNNILVIEEFRFAAKLSTQYQLLLLVKFLSENIKMNISDADTFFGVGKAFIKVWHMRHMYKLRQPYIHFELYTLNFLTIATTHFLSVLMTYATLYI